MIADNYSYAANGRNRPNYWPFAVSIAVHLVLLVVLVWTPSLRESDQGYLPKVIDVQMVDLSDVGGAKESKKVAPDKKAPPVVEEKKEETSEAPVLESESKVKPEVSVAKPRKSTKKALKYKTFKSEKVVQNALKRVEKKLDSQPPKPLEDTIKRIREDVAKKGRPPGSGDTAVKSDAVGKSGEFGNGTRKEGELIDLYRLEIAYEINKNWAFAEQLSGGGKKLMASLAFKVMPDGTITDIFFTDRSGNEYLDDSAYRAIKKSSPVKPHPEKLSRPYVEMGLRFTPEGVR
jgi:colicin import membrane protein